MLFYVCLCGFLIVCGQMYLCVMAKYFQKPLTLFFVLVKSVCVLVCVCVCVCVCVYVCMGTGKPVWGESGELVCLKPIPCQPTHFWNDENGTKYHKAYFSSYPGKDTYFVHNNKTYMQLTYTERTQDTFFCCFFFLIVRIIFFHVLLCICIFYYCQKCEQ